MDTHENAMDEIETKGMSVHGVALREAAQQEAMNSADIVKTIENGVEAVTVRIATMIRLAEHLEDGKPLVDVLVKMHDGLLNTHGGEYYKAIDGIEVE